MNNTNAMLLAAALIPAGVAAEINLLRVFIRDWREGRKEEAGLRRSTPRTSTRRRVARRRQRRWATGLGTGMIAAAIGGPAMAQDAPAESPADGTPVSEAASLTISTDRPSFSDTAGIAPVGHLQLETGYTFTFRDRDGVETQRHNAPEVLARVGVIDDRFELRFSTSGYVWSRSQSDGGSNSVDGWSDVSLGVKFKILDQDGALPRLAFGAATTLGTGEEDISTQRAEPTLKLIWSYDLQKLWGDSFKGFGVYGNVNLGWPNSDGDRFTQGAASICGTYAVTDRFGLFTEYYSVFPAGKNTEEAHSVDFGVSYLLTPRVQLDARVGFGLNDEADNTFVGVGISFLF